MICMDSIPPTGFAAASDFITKSENVRKTPETSTQAITEISHTIRNQVDVIFILRNVKIFKFFKS